MSDTKLTAQLRDLLYEADDLLRNTTSPLRDPQASHEWSQRRRDLHEAVLGLREGALST